MALAITVDDLVVRLLAAIEETERLAQAAAKDTEHGWSAGDEYLSDYVTTVEYGSAVVVGPYSGYMSWELRRYIARHDPASVLRRCAADRKLIELHTPKRIKGDDFPQCPVCIEEKRGYPEEWCDEYHPCRTLLALAVGYGIEEP